MVFRGRASITNMRPRLEWALPRVGVGIGAEAIGLAEIPWRPAKGSGDGAFDGGWGELPPGASAAQPKAGSPLRPAPALQIFRASRARAAYKSGMKFVFEHIGLPTRNPVALKEWYGRVLGAKLAVADGEQPPFLLVMPGGVMIEIYAGDLALEETSNNKLNGWRHVALRVDSIEAAKAELESRGVGFAEPIKPAAGGGRVLFFQDPEGNLLHLVERG